MDVAGTLFEAVELVMRECALFAACGFLILGLSDLAVDLIWIVEAASNRARSRGSRLTAATLPAPARPGRLAVFIPAWEESDVIGQMLRHALGKFDHTDYRLYVGCYPNDPATIAAVKAVADARVRLVIGPAGIM
jgi:adsorption protein B